MAQTVNAHPGSFPVLQIAILVTLPVGVPSLVVKLNHVETSVLAKLLSLAWNPREFAPGIAKLWNCSSTGSAAWEIVGASNAAMTRPIMIRAFI
jgi:hypothetical protein